MNCKICKADCCSRGLNRDAAFCAGWIKMTNADLIRAMTDEELAAWLSFPFRDKERRAGWLDWLKQEVSDDG